MPAKTEYVPFMSYIILILIAIICLFPLVWMLSSSLKSQDEIFTNMSLLPGKLHLRNYVEAWTRGKFSTYFVNSLFYTVLGVFGILVITSLCAYALARLELPFKNLIFFILIIPLIVPLPGTFVPLYVLLKRLGLLDTRTGLILCYINGGLAFGIFLLKSFFEEIPKELEEAAVIDGATKWQIYFRIMLPLVKPALATLAIFNTVAIWNEFLLALIILQDPTKMPIQRGLMVFQGTHITEYAQLMAGLSIATLPVIMIYLLMQKYIIKGITAGALKG
ncbi:MAG: carbohydrate ABC transporter permease [Endomicrobia bacterium]|nr:carbohydrate ABC transporter permease [Endomicrobiia bacterium]